jgi:hypothetical protein
MLSHIICRRTSHAREKNEDNAIADKPGHPLSLHLLYSTRIPQSSCQSSSSSYNTAEKASSTNANENINQILFLPRLRHLVELVSSQSPPSPPTGINNLSINLFITNATSVSSTSVLKTDSSAINTRFQRITSEDLNTVLASSESTTVCYICGPPPMTDSFVKIAEGIIGTERVFCEKWW